MTRTTIGRGRALALSTTLLVAACGSTTVSSSPSATASSAPTATPAPSTAAPSPSSAPPATPMPDDVAAAIYDAIEGQVLDIRGLDAVSVQRETIDAATLKEMNATSFDEDNPADYVAGNDRLLKALGLIPEASSLRQLYLDLIDSQVAGFYRPDAKTLYVVSRSGAINGADKITFAHEYGHALQDANFPGVFDAQRDLLDQSDQALARAGVYEGDATLLMQLWALAGNLTPEELQDVIAAGADPESTAVLARTPDVLVQTLLFPYNTGQLFANTVYQAEGWEGVDDLYAELPVSTEQVLHPEKYTAREDPIEVALPADLAASMGDGWSALIEDTYGEFQIDLWLQTLGATDDLPSRGWGGDRLQVLQGPDDSWALAWHTIWDTPADAQEFETGATAALAKAGGPAGVLPGEGGADRWVLVASDDDVFGRLATVLGLAG